jgi:general stress protein 26
MATRDDDREQKEKLWDLIKDIEFAMLTTIDQDGSLHSRPMATAQAEFDGDLWFFTEASAHKTSEVGAHHEVNLSYADPQRQTYVSVSGTASPVRDKAKAQELWSNFMRAWFPNGPDDPNLALLRVRVDHAEYWDGPSSRMVVAYRLAVAAATGRRPDLGEHEKLDG